MNKNLLKIGTFAALTLTAACSTPGETWRKTATEQALIFWSTGNFERAVNYAQKALKDNPQDVYALMVAGMSYDSLGYPNQSRRYYEDILMSDTTAVGVLSAVKSMPAEDLKKGAKERLQMMELKKRPFAIVNPQTGISAFAESPKVSPAPAPAPAPAVKGGFDMLNEGDRNIVMRFLTFKRLRDERYVTEQEWLNRRTVNLGGLLPYTLTPAGLGLDLPAPDGNVIVERLDALRNALEMRAITPREHAAEREIILEALLPSNPFYRMNPKAPPKDILEAATALRQVETLKNLGLITPVEAKSETAAIEKLTYAKIGMTGGGQATPSAAKCIQKCLSAPATPCPAVSKPAPKKKAVKAKSKPKPKPQTCPCP